MHERRLEVAIEREVELIVQRADPVPGGHRLRDVCEPAARGVELEPLGEQCRELVPGDTADAGAKDGDESAGRERPDHLVVVILERWRCDANEFALLAKDRAVESLQLGAWIDPKLIHERPPCGVVRGERFRLSAALVEREHQMRRAGARAAGAPESASRSLPQGRRPRLS